MSGICGIVHFDGAPADPLILERMAGEISHFGPDGTNFWTEGPAGVAHLAFHTTPESEREEQPLRDRSGRFVLAADARVDNRDELIRVLEAGTLSGDTSPTDADLILAAWERWGEECTKHIVGDFAFVIWDRKERRLFCARDPIGIRPFFYCRRGATFTFGTSAQAVIAGLDACPPLNDLMVVDFLCLRFERWKEETFLSGCVPAAGFPLPERRRWREPGSAGTGRSVPRAPMPCSSDGEYVELFRELFTRAVRRRMRSSTPVGVLLSGGLDSSSIACIADRLRESGEGAAGRSPLHFYSAIFSDFPRADERRYLQAVLDRCPGVPSTRIEGEGIEDMLSFISDRGLPSSDPDIYPLGGMFVFPPRGGPARRPAGRSSPVREATSC